MCCSTLSLSLNILLDFPVDTGMDKPQRCHLLSLKFCLAALAIGKSVFF